MHTNVNHEIAKGLWLTKQFKEDEDSVTGVIPGSGQVQATSTTPVYKLVIVAMTTQRVTIKAYF